MIEGINRLLNRTLGVDIEIKLNLGAGVWPVNADPSQLGASLINIANNARDAMPNGGVLTIATSNQELDADYAATHIDLVPGNYTLIEMSDTGTGIPPEISVRSSNRSSPPRNKARAQASASAWSSGL